MIRRLNFPGGLKTENAEQYAAMVGARLTLSENSALVGSMAAMMAMGGMSAGN